MFPKVVDQLFDVAVIGGGINGCGCAADAALRGLSVVLLEQDDLASKTSSSSTKLIHGGLRYLEHHAFSLVKKALDERQTLLDLAPQLVHTQAFVLPYKQSLRPFWLLRLGLFVYDHLSPKNKVPSCKTIRRNAKNTYFSPLMKDLKKGFLFYDAETDDARLTLANALQARHCGASIRVRSKVIKVELEDQLWRITVQPQQGSTYTLLAKALINAAGPWVSAVEQIMGIHKQKQLTLVKGSHIVVPKLYEGKQAYLLQHTDKRVVFAIPYHGYTLIGTTEVPYSFNLGPVAIDEAEIDYLLAVVNSYFEHQSNKEDIALSWSGVRPLLAQEGTGMDALSRDYRFELDTSQAAPLITIYGGKITTYRVLAQEIINQLEPFFPAMAAARTAKTPLPGAFWGDMSFAEYVSYAKKKYFWLDAGLLQRYLFTYGTNTECFLAPCTSYESMGIQFSPSLYQVEVDYLLLEEWAQTSEDILLRRTKLILEMDKAEQEALEQYVVGCWAEATT